MCSATMTWPSFHSPLAFASSDCTSWDEVNVFVRAAPACGAGGCGVGVASVAGVALGLPAVTTTAATRASRIPIPRLRISTCFRTNFRWSLSYAVSYTPGALLVELQMSPDGFFRIDTGQGVRNSL